MKTTNKVKLILRFYGREESKIPSVSFEGPKGIPGTGSDDSSPVTKAFNEFHKAAHEFCKALIEAGEIQ